MAMVRLSGIKKSCGGTLNSTSSPSVTLLQQSRF